MPSASSSKLASSSSSLTLSSKVAEHSDRPSDKKSRIKRNKIEQKGPPLVRVNLLTHSAHR